MRRFLITVLSIGTLASGCSHADRTSDARRGCSELRQRLIGEWYYTKDPNVVLSISDSSQVLLSDGVVYDSVGIQIVDLLADCRDTLSQSPPSKLFVVRRTDRGNADTVWVLYVDSTGLEIFDHSLHGFNRVRSDPGSIAYRWMIKAAMDEDTVRVSNAYNAANTWVHVWSMEDSRLVGDSISSVRNGSEGLAIAWFRELTGVHSDRIAFLIDYRTRRILDGIRVTRDHDVDFSVDSFSWSEFIAREDTLMVIETDYVVTDHDQHEYQVAKELGRLYLPTSNGFHEVGIRRRTKHDEELRWEDFR